MAKHKNVNHNGGTLELPRIETPPSVRPTAEEIERRRIIVERMIERSDRVGPIGIRVDDLLHLAESESES